MPKLYAVKNVSEDSALVGTKLFDKPEFDGDRKGKKTKSSVSRFKKAKDAFLNALEVKGPKVPTFVEGAELSPPQSPIGYLAFASSRISLFEGTTFVAKKDGKYASSPRLLQNSVVVGVVQSSMSQASISVEGDSNLYHHGAAFAIDGQVVRVILFSADLWIREDKNAKK